MLQSVKFFVGLCLSIFYLPIVCAPYLDTCTQGSQSIAIAYVFAPIAAFGLWAIATANKPHKALWLLMPAHLLTVGVAGYTVPKYFYLTTVLGKHVCEDLNGWDEKPGLDQILWAPFSLAMHFAFCWIIFKTAKNTFSALQRPSN